MPEIFSFFSLLTMVFLKGITILYLIDGRGKKSLTEKPASQTIPTPLPSPLEILKAKN